LQESFDAIKISDKNKKVVLDTQPIADTMDKAINDLNKLVKEAPTESQNKRILKHLKSGKTLTGLEALRLFDCFSLPQRIGNLRSFGFVIKTTMITTDSGKRIAEYSIENND
jgi:hypothetical protein